MKKKSVVRLLRKTSSVLLGGIQVVVDGVSSATQIGDFTTASWAKGASFAGSFVEGEIYAKNADESYDRLCLLSKKALWAYVVIQAFEERIVIEKELKEKLKKSLETIKENISLDDGEQEELNKYIDSCASQGNNDLIASNLSALELYFENITNKRCGTQEYINDCNLELFGLVKKGFAEFKNQHDENSGPFWISYKANKAILEKSELFSAIEIEEAEKRLKLLRKYLVARVACPESAPNFVSSDLALIVPPPPGGEESLINNSFQAINPVLFSKLQEQLSIGKSKSWPLRLGILFSLVSGIAIGVVTFYTFPAVLAFIGLAALSTAVWPLVVFTVFAAIAYTLLIYNTVADLIINETLSKWWKKLSKEIEQAHGNLNRFQYAFLAFSKTISQIFSNVVNWFKPKQKENWAAYGLRIVLSLVVVGFGVIAALATGYTAFFQLQQYVSLAVCIITALPLLLGDLIFTLKNSFESITLLAEISFANLFDDFKTWKKNIAHRYQTENYLQIVPQAIRQLLQAIRSGIKLLLFGVHLFFTAVSCDRLFNIPCGLVLIITMVSELLTDICPLFGNSKGHGHHDHDHGGLIDWLAKPVFFIFAIVLGSLNWFCSQFNHFCKNPELKPLKFLQAIKQELEQFEVWHFHEEKENEEQTVDIGQRQNAKLPEEILFQENIRICVKRETVLKSGFFNSNLAQKKKVIFEEHRAAVVCAFKSGVKLPHLSAEKKAILAKHRFGIFNGGGETESIKQLKKMHRWSIEKDSDSSTLQSNGYVNGHTRCA